MTMKFPVRKLMKLSVINYIYFKAVFETVVACFRFSNNRFGRPSTNAELATVSVYSEAVASVTPASGRRYQSSSRRSSFRPSNNAVDSNSNRDSRRGFKPKPTTTSPVDQGSSTSLYKFKLSRPSGRWQYKTTPKPRISIRRQDEGGDNTTLTHEHELKLDPDQELSNQDISTAADRNDNTVSIITEPTLPIETIKIEISTPADFKNTYYEIATVKSPYTFQVIENYLC